ncbi:MAG: YraN family protein [Pseudomonadota bacterium]|nr:YraN family protein [Pseudomonadota bacterium]
MNVLQSIKSKFIGQNKEQQAAKWLQQNHFEIIAQNYLCKGGEIDLIGFESKQNRLIFFEVKYRKNNHYGDPAETLSTQQQQRIVRCAQRFLQQHPQYQDKAMQFDLLTFLDQQTEPHRIENAFGL